ncbi:MAG: type II toxin-antitoxin system VapC family toxin [Alphaproteobacteria bacterium]|nr:type II toxin-antitoxin system VapC family toxin [Alphaproteobacteria bacterium]
MVLPDVNVLIYAFRADSPRHVTAKHWLDSVILGDAPFGMSPLVLAAVVRITSNPRIFLEPSPLAEVFSYCDNLLHQPHCRTLRPGEQHWAIFRELCVSTGTQGARVSDAWLAALAIEHGCTFITFDRDYARFSGLPWSEPKG